MNRTAIKNKINVCADCGKPIYSGTYRLEHGDLKEKLYYHSWCGEAKQTDTQIEKEKEKSKQQIQLEKWYEFIYKKFNGVCAETGRQLKFDKKYCSHLLPKKSSGTRFNYSYFALAPENGILVDWNIHDIIDKGSAEQRLALKIWGRIRASRKKMLESVGMEYDENFWLNSKY